MAKAIKKIQKAVQIDPKDVDSWILWGLIMRTVGNYKSAKHKFERAQKLDPENTTAKFEMELLDRIMDLDQQLPIEHALIYKKMRPNFDSDL